MIPIIEARPWRFRMSNYQLREATGCKTQRSRVTSDAISVSGVIARSTLGWLFNSPLQQALAVCVWARGGMPLVSDSIFRPTHN